MIRGTGSDQILGKVVYPSINVLFYLFFFKINNIMIPVLPTMNYWFILMKFFVLHRFNFLCSREWTNKIPSLLPILWFWIFLITKIFVISKYFYPRKLCRILLFRMNRYEDGNWRAQCFVNFSQDMISRLCSQLVIFTFLIAFWSFTNFANSSLHGTGCTLSQFERIWLRNLIF